MAIDIVFTVAELVSLASNIRTLDVAYYDNPESLQSLITLKNTIISNLEAIDSIKKNPSQTVQIAMSVIAVDPAKWTEFIANLNTLLAEVKVFINDKFAVRQRKIAEAGRNFLRFSLRSADKGTIDGFCARLSVVIQDATFMLLHDGHVGARTLAENLLNEMKFRSDRSESKALEAVFNLLDMLTTSNDERRQELNQLKHQIEELAPVIMSRLNRIESMINNVNEEQKIQSTTIEGIKTPSASILPSSQYGSDDLNMVEQYKDILNQFEDRSPNIEISPIDVIKVQHKSKNEPILHDFGDWAISFCKYNNRTRWMKRCSKTTAAKALLTEIEARIQNEICQLAKSKSQFFLSIHQFVAFGVICGVPTIIYEKAICSLSSAMSLQAIRNRLNRISHKLLLSKFLDVCDAVAFLHRNDYLHRNINIDNILIVSSDWEMKLSGFQYACGSTDESLPVPGKELFLNHSSDIQEMMGIFLDLINSDLFENDISEYEKAQVDQIVNALDNNDIEAMKKLSIQVKPILRSSIESKTGDATIEEKFHNDNPEIMEYYEREFQNGWTVEALISKYLFEQTIEM